MAEKTVLVLLQDGTEIQAYVAECQKQIVGIAIIRREEVRALFIQSLLLCYRLQWFLVFSVSQRPSHAHHPAIQAVVG